MFTPILATKLYIPPTRPDFIPRPRLVEQLNTGVSCKLTLISASAGFGKTSLLSQWIANNNRPAAWVSLDNNDNEVVRFFAYFISALQRIRDEIGGEALEILQSARAPSHNVILTSLINEIAAICEPFALILDDYHVITNQQIHDAIVFMIENLPHTMHLVVSSRNDPPWPLARLRARRELTEIRSNDLRFTLEETSTLLHNMIDLEVSADEVRSLDERTEGWIAGLQMAALSMQGREDISGFVETFSGSNRFILDYLMDEVLKQCSPETLDFLLKTSVLERMTAPLCDTVVGIEDSQSILASLEKSNLFLVSLDDERCWYRYHHLFADLLHNHLKQTLPDQLSGLHIRASRWYEREGLTREATFHALAGGDYESAANLVEQKLHEAFHNESEGTLFSWIETLPEEIVRKRPWLCIFQAYMHFSFGPRTMVEEWLQRAEQEIERSPTTFKTQITTNKLTADEKERLVGAIAAMRAHNTLLDGDIPQVMEYVAIALDYLLDEDPWRKYVLVALGVAYWAQGDRAACEEAFASSSAGLLTINSQVRLVYVGTMQAKQGRLYTAYETYQGILNKMVRPDGEYRYMACFPAIKIGDVLREWDDLEGAKRYIDLGYELAQKYNQLDVLIEAYIVQARLYLALEDHQRAFEAIEKADEILESDPVDLWFIGWLGDCKVRYWLSTGNLSAAVRWVEDSRLTSDVELSYHKDLHHVNLARLLVTQGELDPAGPYLGEAHKLLARLLAAAEKAEWVQESIKILILQARASWASGQQDKAVDTLVHALTLAEPGGYVCAFIDEGDLMDDLLKGVLAKSRGGGLNASKRIPEYAMKLLAALGKPQPAMYPASPPPDSSLVEPLSERELEVLRFLNSHLSSTEIAAELTVSANTVRFHIKNIYSKLSVHSRSGAVEKAKRLSLI